MKEVTSIIDLKANKDQKKNINKIADFPLTSRLFSVSNGAPLSNVLHGHGNTSTCIPTLARESPKDYQKLVR